MTFKLASKGKTLFIIAGIVLLISVLGSPFALLLFYVAFAAHVTIDNDTLTYKMFSTKKIPFREIKALTIGRLVQAPMQVGAGRINFANVVPLTVSYGDKKIIFSLNYFQNPEEILKLLREKTKLPVKGPDGEIIE